MLFRPILHISGGVFAVLVLGLSALPCQAATIENLYIESFEASSTDQTVRTLATYPDFHGLFPIDGSAVVVDQSLQILPGTANTNQAMILPGPAGAATISTKVAADNSNGSYNVGLVIGGNTVVFHPGYGGGALRVTGAGGFGNQNVGFTPANGVLHDLSVTPDGAGLFNITFTDGANGANTWTGSFTNAASVGQPVGLLRSGQATGMGLYDDLNVGGTVHSFDTNTNVGTSHIFDIALSGGEVYTDSGRLYLQGGGANTSKSLLRSGLVRDHTIVTQVGSTLGGGNYNVGLRVGENNIVFHPGYSGGAFRVDGPGGFGNTNLGFTPAANVAHELRVDSDGTGNFDITFIDGANSANVWTGSFNNPNSVGGAFGPWRNGPTTGSGFFDTLDVVLENQVILQGELFDLDADTDIGSIYPNWTASLAGGGAVVDDGQLRLNAPVGGNNNQTFLTNGSSEPFRLTALVGADNGNGSYNVGLVIGENSIAFHPGYATGAFRIGGTGGFGNTDVGFDPANGVLHQLEVISDGLGTFDITLIDGADPSNIFTTSFFNPASVGGLVGFRRSGQANGLGLFDEFIMTTPVPEPTSIVLALLGFTALIFTTRYRRKIW